MTRGTTRAKSTAHVILGAIALCVSSVALAASVLLGWSQMHSDGLLWVDIETYVNAFNNLTEGRSVYSPLQLAGPYMLPEVVRSGYAYPPPTPVLFAPFALVPFGKYAWIVLNTACFLAGVLRVVRHETGGRSHATTAAVLLSLSLFYPLAQGTGSGNVNVAIAGLVALAWVPPAHRPSLPAIGVAFASTLKLFPAALFVWMSLQGEFRRVAYVVAAAIIALFVSVAFTGLEVWGDFVIALRNAEPSCGGFAPSVACVATPVVGSELAKLLGLAVAGGAILTMTVVRNRLVGFWLVGIAMIAPVSDLHDHTWLIAYVLVLVTILHIASPHFHRDLSCGST